ncbi:acetate--CoA ligase family protein [Dongia soli]|uniref:Acetate--CoA ligase family protein n=1 Tax=Dongia soli TaxID=600628 RepID=A0ABU5EEK1_9PROT|nr:acetate--CoA ligase family protein [Dongia soli]MDY0884804.1 acetate--CoA ligase family protein [Dongia soli]
MTLSRLANPQSIAILGASERPSIGRTLIQSLSRLGFPGRVYPINPKYDELLGLKCYRSVNDLPEAPDVVSICVGDRIVEHLQTLADKGAGGAVIYGGGFAERGDEGKKTQQAIADICRAGNISLCGPNCMGIFNPPARSTTYIYEVRDPKGLPGNVALISQSGSIGNGLLGDVRRFGFSLIASTGNEAVVDTAALIDYLIDDPATKVIATFTETVRSPERYVAALDRAADCGKPVVVLKVGQSERARHAITSHTGGLAGESRVFSELLRAHRAIEVNDMDELTEVLAVCQGKRLPRGRRSSVITGSGGQAELILDVATASGWELPPLSAADRAKVESVQGPITGDGNPLDSWGNGDWRTNLPNALAVLNESEDHDSIVYCADCNEKQPMIGEDRLLDEMKLLVEAAENSDKPHYLMNTRPGLMNLTQVNYLAEHGIPQIGGTRQGLGAIDRVARHLAPLPPLRQVKHPASPDLNGTRQVIGEYDAKKLLQPYGVPVSREHLVRALDDGRSVAREIGFPVVLKVVSDDIPHKSEHGLVIVGLRNEAEFDAAWRLLEERLSRLDNAKIDGYLVQEFVADGIEVFGGVSRDPDFGLSLAFGMGGIGIEVMKDFALRLLPLRNGDIEALIGETKGAALLRPYRGRPGADLRSLVDCLYGLADFAQANAERIAEIDLNPIKVREDGKGCVVVDALIVLR